MPTDYAIKDGRTVFDATTYTGNGSTQSITNAGNFQPDLVWIKARKAAASHIINDSVRGVSKQLVPNGTGAETTYTGYQVTAFNSNGVTLVDDSNGGYGVNGGSGGTYSGTPPNYIAWQWKANGTAVSNTSGTITSSVSANTTAGFSIVTYTGNGTAGATVGHGLGVAPKLIIGKKRSAAADWTVYHASLGNNLALFLNGTFATDAGAAYWNTTTPTSSVFTLGNQTNLNASGATTVAYCWAEIAGFSKFGSYTGNGSTDGPFVYTGFRPKFIMTKRTDSTSSWNIVDTSRVAYNANNAGLYANLTGAEDTTGAVVWDVLSNGFKLRDSDATNNASGGTYIYVAFAENPFKYANAR